MRKKGKDKEIPNSTKSAHPRDEKKGKDKEIPNSTNNAHPRDEKKGKVKEIPNRTNSAHPREEKKVSTNTLGLCSQCYKAHIEKTNDALQSTPDHMISPEKARQMKQNSHNHSLEGASQQPCSSKDFANCASKDYSTSENAQSALNIDQGKGQGDSTVSMKPEQNLAQKSDSKSECATISIQISSSEDKSESNIEQSLSSSSSSQTVTSSAVCNITSSNSSSETTAEKDSHSDVGTPQKKGVKRELESDESSLDATPEKGPGQKNKKRCFHCKTKLELAQRQIGRCKCDYVFCSLHRLPELHNCAFDHKEDGRREAREKMVKPTRHLGTSFKRLDSS
ncbi:hypothetical protein FSP39_010450 [Pinctada imbricata]|uniref:AN1-type domain-containing protein n=1 Tax=Pinctada imbricata TaxID=66713 RepID=A0AA88Y3C2_PINIB|nr:hypothetical protein FSP39_010450 [Pinctada imbricata]